MLNFVFLLVWLAGAAFPASLALLIIQDSGSTPRKAMNAATLAMVVFAAVLSASSLVPFIGARDAVVESGSLVIRISDDSSGLERVVSIMRATSQFMVYAVAAYSVFLTAEGVRVLARGDVKPRDLGHISEHVTLSLFSVIMLAGAAVISGVVAQAIHIFDGMIVITRDGVGNGLDWATSTLTLLTVLIMGSHLVYTAGVAKTHAVNVAAKLRGRGERV